MIGILFNSWVKYLGIIEYCVKNKGYMVFDSLIIGYIVFIKGV